MEALQNLLRELAGAGGIRAALVVGLDGLVIEGVSTSSDLDNEAVGATISAEIGSAEVIGKELRAGGIKQMMMEFEDCTIVLHTIAGDAFLAVVADADAVVGYIRYQVRKFSTDVERLL